tara:strand:- start:121 stop:474 length:354 start_codon:yes stop_codon:yes gene_type:complete
MFQNIQESIGNMNENKLFIGLMVITVTIGGRFIVDEFNDSQKKMINNKLVRRLFAFCVFFMATRDICTSFILTIIFALVMSSLVGDDSEKEVDSNEENLKQKLMNIQFQLNEIQKQL